MKRISQMFCPSGFTCPKTIYCLMNDQIVPFKFTKLKPCNNMQLFLIQCLQISIPNIHSLDFQVVQHGQKGAYLNFLDRCNLIVKCIIVDRFSEMSCNQSCLPPK